MAVANALSRREAVDDQLRLLCVEVAAHRCALPVDVVVEIHPATALAEPAEQAEELRRLGCDFGQGFLWGRPLAPDDLERWWDPHSEPSPVGGHP